MTPPGSGIRTTRIRPESGVDQPLRASSVHFPSDIMTLCEQNYDSKTVQLKPTDWGKYQSQWNLPSQNSQDYLTAGMSRHNGGMSAVAADGHAVRLKMPPYSGNSTPPVGFGDLEDIKDDGVNSQWKPTGTIQLYIRQINTPQGF